MLDLFFWIIILSLLIPVAMRMYRKSVDRRNQQGFSGGYPGQFPGQFPGSAGPQSKQPRDGYTQQDYFAGPFRRIERQQPLPPNEPLPGQPLPGQYGQPPVPPAGAGSWGPQEPPFQQPETRQPAPEQPAAPATPPPPSAPQGYRARKLAELDQQYSNGELSVEEYMTRRGEIMNG
ncbi:hypothetical protein ACLH0K_06365 [Arthrobacter sp. MPF02]|uniref:hypothetical protein n=1 Tax=Arthrobacter sp. MPF02 TaxID=3388492 RepID=UPI003984DD79